MTRVFPDPTSPRSSTSRAAPDTAATADTWEAVRSSLGSGENTGLHDGLSADDSARRRTERADTVSAAEFT